MNQIECPNKYISQTKNENEPIAKKPSDITPGIESGLNKNNDVVTKRIKWTVEMVRTNLLECGYILISEDYINNNQKLELQCLKCNYKFPMRFRAIRDGQNCPNCMNRRSATFPEVVEIFERAGCVLLEDVYIDSAKHLHFICAGGHLCRMTLNNFNRGKRCKICAYDKSRGRAIKHGLCIGDADGRFVTGPYYQYLQDKNPFFKLRRAISGNISRIIKEHNGNRSGSIFDYLPYNPQQLREHLESLWEPWMNWENYGGRANDPRKTWWLDHIVPQTALPYDSMSHSNFLKCWDLSNLRPLEKLENISKNNGYWSDENQNFIRNKHQYK